MFGKFSNIGNLLSLFYSNFFSNDGYLYLNIEQKKSTDSHSENRLMLL